nr:MAG TPA: hypothetical protein [Caudoviricetes sp.]
MFNSFTNLRAIHLKSLLTKEPYILAGSLFFKFP